VTISVLLGSCGALRAIPTLADVRSLSGSAGAVRGVRRLHIAHDGDRRSETGNEGSIVAQGESDHLTGDLGQQHSPGGINGGLLRRTHGEPSGDRWRLHRLAEEILDRALEGASER
jgi:hypothetical protein